MRSKPLGLALVACALLAGCVSGPDHPGPPPPNLPPAPPNLAEAAVAQEAASRPGAHHRALEPLIGEWETSNVAVDADGNETDPIAGRARIEWTLGGRYLAVEAVLALPIGPRHSRGYLGYDDTRSEYQWLMVSDLSTGMGVARGRGELDRGGIRFTLEALDPRTQAFARATSVFRQIGEKHVVLEQIAADANGLERVVRRTHYRR